MRYLIEVHVGDDKIRSEIAGNNLIATMMVRDLAVQTFDDWEAFTLTVEPLEEEESTE